jgi:tetratricopeptide (TPR) repeat protein
MLCVRSLAVLISAVLIAVLLRPVLSGYYAGNPSGNPLSNLFIASKITSEDARYHYLLGLLHQKHGGEGSLEETIASYHSSLQRDPTRAFTWLALSKAHEAQDSKTLAEYAVRKAVAVDRANPRIIWEAGMFYLTEGQAQEAAPYFKRYLRLVPAEQESIYTMIHAAGIPSAYVLENMLPREYRFYNHYFRFLVAYKQSAELLEVWEARDSWHPADADYLTYCDFLVETGRVHEAQDVWAEFVRGNYQKGAAPDSSDLIFNGGFEYRIQGGGFDWKIGNADGVEILVDNEMKKSGRSSLTALFSGKTNPGIYVAQQPVAVKANQRYRVSCQIRTDRLTTRNGVLLEVVDQARSSLSARSEAVTGTNDWRGLELEFTAPAACSLVRIGIKREYSEKFDSKISGAVWLDDFNMTELKN